jgi:drug/metabolite transporter (DMT)-like permease
MNKYIKIILSILAPLFGLFLVVFGGYDDSPGAQGLGFILIIIAVIVATRRKKNNTL